MERHLARDGARPAELRRRGPDGHLLAAVGPTDDRHGPPARGPRHPTGRKSRLALRVTTPMNDHRRTADTPMPPVVYGPPELVDEVEAFLAYDSELLDEWALDEWVQRFA